MEVRAMEADASKKIFYQRQAENIIRKLSARHMEGYYCPDIDSAKKKVVELISKGMDGRNRTGRTVAYGGSMTIDNTDLKQMISDSGQELIVREKYGPDPEAQKELKSRQINADSFLMSTNAITVDGELINIDGRGNRVSYLIYGPEQVIVIAGMNKVVPNVEDGIRRVRNEASPANTIRLHCDTPCVKTGQCMNCLDHTICCQFVVTRASLTAGRIKVVLVGEELGY